MNMLFMSVTLEVLHELMSWLNEVARMNMLFMSVTDDTSQVETSPLKTFALGEGSPHANIPCIVVTLLVFQLDRSPPANLRAVKNICPIFLTDPTSHLDRSPLKFLAPANMSCMFVTLPTFQSPISLLKLVAVWSMYCMSVTCEVSHAEIFTLN